MRVANIRPDSKFINTYQVFLCRCNTPLEKWYEKPDEMLLKLLIISIFV
jgi:hypothetical protein